MSTGARAHGRSSARRFDQRNVIRWIAKPIIWVGALTPAALLLIRFFQDDLGANPIEKITHWTGRTALTLLMISLAVTPIRRITGFNQVIQLRRLLGLFAFFYAVLHFSTYVVLDLFFDFSAVAEDILERPYITVGFTAFVLLIPLALTSTKGWIRRLGKRWTIVHRLVYISAGLAVLHFLWKVKADSRLPLIYASVLAILLLLRLPLFRLRRGQAQKTAEA
jgi:sulfoxide reductase heme-binding subunit YedZ